MTENSLASCVGKGDPVARIETDDAFASGLEDQLGLAAQTICRFFGAFSAHEVSDLARQRAEDAHHAFVGNIVIARSEVHHRDDLVSKWDRDAERAVQSEGQRFRSSQERPTSSQVWNANDIACLPNGSRQSLTRTQPEPDAEFAGANVGNGGTMPMLDQRKIPA